ncbi:hypothetical protein ASG36_20905 [Geodermatophilus sp. Leaf369]|uniref:IclR family transcriptional regulator n=1 Tax=Geodermatophilus sp. Leaf369 TaxID=1736354 RepID=UPI0006F7B86F|nr:IclR family transcriptional regulator [Geodermatophilus sp. Leaf369]KQS54554.1 hypothetical protein ASG36_20905 [Geodermatophilus sp. Leaf369]
MTGATGESKDRLSRIFEVLELLAGESAGMTVTQVSKAMGMPLSSTHNLLQRLVGSDAAVVSEDLRYSIGGRAVRYGIRIMDALQVRGLARKHLQELARSLGEDVYLAERFGNRVTYTDRVVGPRAMALDIRLGQRLFLHATSVGKLFAALDPELRDEALAGPLPQLTPATLVDPDALATEFDRIADQGYAVSDQESYAGIVGIAVPVRDAGDRVVAAIHLSALEAHRSPDQQLAWLEHIRETAAQVERSLGRVVPD